MQQQDFLTRSKHRQHITEIPASLLRFPVSCRLKFERLFSVYREVNGLSLVSVNSCPRTTQSDTKISRPKPASVPQIHRITSETPESIIIFHWLKTHHQFCLTSKLTTQPHRKSFAVFSIHTTFESIWGSGIFAYYTFIFIYGKWT